MFSRACQYGVRATIFLARQSGKRIGLRDIAREIDSPEAFTAKILQELVRNNIISSVKGPAGGFEIPENRLGKISLRQIVSAIDGEDIFTACGLGLKQCSALQPCPVHNQFKLIREDLSRMLQTTTLLMLSTGQAH